MAAVPTSWALYSRVLALRAALDEAELDAALAISGLDSGQCDACADLIRWLLVAAPDAERDMTAALDDTVMLVTSTSVALYVASADWPFAVAATASWPATRLYALPPELKYEPDEREAFKVDTFLSMLAGLLPPGARVGVPMRSTEHAPDAVLGPMTIERWSLVQAYALEDVGRGQRGFFTMAYLVTDLSPVTARLQTSHHDSLSIRALATSSAAMLATNWRAHVQVLDALATSPPALAAASEAQLCEPLSFFHAYGAVAETAATTQRPQPQVLIGARVGLVATAVGDDAPMRDEPGSGAAAGDGAHTGAVTVDDTVAGCAAVRAVDARTGLRVTRMHFWHALSAAAERMAEYARVREVVGALVRVMAVGELTTADEAQQWAAAALARHGSVQPDVRLRIVALGPAVDRPLGGQAPALPAVNSAVAFLELAVAPLGVAFGETVAFACPQPTERGRATLVLTDQIAGLHFWGPRGRVEWETFESELETTVGRAVSMDVGAVTVFFDTSALIGCGGIDSSVEFHSRGMALTRSPLGSLVVPVVDGVLRVAVVPPCGSDDEPGALTLLLVWFDASSSAAMRWLDHALGPRAVSALSSTCVAFGFPPRTPSWRALHRHALGPWRHWWKNTTVDEVSASGAAETAVARALVPAAIANQLAVRGRDLGRAAAVDSFLDVAATSERVCATRRMGAPPLSALAPPHDGLVRAPPREPHEHEHEHKFVLTVVCGVPGSQRDAVVRSVLSATGGTVAWRVVRQPLGLGLDLDANWLARTLDVLAGELDAARDAVRPVRVMFCPPGASDVASVAAAIEHLCPRFTIGAVTAVINTAQHQLVVGRTALSVAPIPHWREQFRPGFAQNLAFAYVPDSPGGWRASELRRLALAYCPTATTLACTPRNAISAPGALDAMLARDAFARTASERERHFPCWLGAELARARMAPDAQAILRLPVRLDRARLDARLAELAAGEVSARGASGREVQLSVALIVGAVDVMERDSWASAPEAPVTRVTVVLAGGERTVGEPTDDVVLAPDEPPTCVFVGAALDRAALISFVLSCRPVPPAETPLKVEQSLDRADTATVRAICSQLPLPDGVFHDGMGYLDFRGARSADHPRFDEMRLAWVAQRNAEIESTNARIREYEAALAAELAAVMAANGCDTEQASKRARASESASTRATSESARASALPSRTTEPHGSHC